MNRSVFPTISDNLKFNLVFPTYSLTIVNLRPPESIDAIRYNLK